MSRIHEALKKAEKEKAISQQGGMPQGLADGQESNSAAQSSAPVQTAAAAVADVPVAHTGVAVAEPGQAPLELSQLQAKCARPGWNPDPKFLVFSSSDPFATGAEEFRTLRSRLYRIRESQPLRTVLIASAVPAEGKTFVAANLAQSIVRQLGCRVLLIDADMRSPRLHTLLGAPPEPGLANYLQGGVKEVEVIQKNPDSELYFIPAGYHVTHPSELIANGRLNQLLERVGPLFDWIIVDSPPALPVSDASVLARMCDGVLLVVRARSTPSEAAAKACHELQDGNLIGVVLNTVDSEDSSYAGGYGHYGSQAASTSAR
jgi:capsular exopolysaccharide synthesis family protein